MAEMVLVNLLMNGDADRDERNDWTEMGLSLPFIEEVSAGLGIAVKTYLDELSNEVEPTSEEAKNRQKEKLPRMFAQAVDIVGDVKLAFRVWDAVSTPKSPRWGFSAAILSTGRTDDVGFQMVVGVKVLRKQGLLVNETKTFLAADVWLAARR